VRTETLPNATDAFGRWARAATIDSTLLFRLHATLPQFQAKRLPFVTANFTGSDTNIIHLGMLACFGRLSSICLFYSNQFPLFSHF
jgi:hypothetical protein